jgi:hypothetical protein
VIGFGGDAGDAEEAFQTVEGFIAGSVDGFEDAVEVGHDTVLHERGRVGDAALSGMCSRNEPKWVVP